MRVGRADCARLVRPSVRPSDEVGAPPSRAPSVNGVNDDERADEPPIKCSLRRLPDAPVSARTVGRNVSFRLRTRAQDRPRCLHAIVVVVAASLSLSLTPLLFRSRA